MYYILDLVYYMFHVLYIYIYMQGGSAHALIFSWACWSGIWPRMDARRRRRLAGLNGLKNILMCWRGPEPLTKLFLHILTPRGRLGAVQHGFMQGIPARVFLDRSRAPKPL